MNCASETSSSTFSLHFVSSKRWCFEFKFRRRNIMESSALRTARSSTCPSSAALEGALGTGLAFQSAAFSRQRGRAVSSSETRRGWRVSLRVWAFQERRRCRAASLPTMVPLRRCPTPDGFGSRATLRSSPRGAACPSARTHWGFGWPFEPSRHLYTRKTRTLSACPPLSSLVQYLHPDGSSARSTSSASHK